MTEEEKKKKEALKEKCEVLCKLFKDVLGDKGVSFKRLSMAGYMSSKKSMGDVDMPALKESDVDAKICQQSNIW
ncbi:hypothetical protein Tco_0780717 [Tanacetum coccineum]